MTFDLHIRDISLEYFLFNLIYCPHFSVHGSFNSYVDERHLSLFFFYSSPSINIPICHPLVMEAIN